MLLLRQFGWLNCGEHAFYRIMGLASDSHRGARMTRAHDDIDRRFGTASHKLAQTQLAEALGMTFLQVQKYERDANAVASTGIPDPCRVLKTCSDDLFDFRGETASQPLQMSTWAARMARRHDGLNNKGAQCDLGNARRVGNLKAVRRGAHEKAPATDGRG